jgi:hypothetical protein
MSNCCVGRNFSSSVLSLINEKKRGQAYMELGKKNCSPLVLTRRLLFSYEARRGEKDILSIDIMSTISVIILSRVAQLIYV